MNEFGLVYLTQTLNIYLNYISIIVEHLVVSSPIIKLVCVIQVVRIYSDVKSYLWCSVHKFSLSTLNIPETVIID